MTLLQFATRHLGQRVRSAGGLGGQCVDLTELWAAELGKRPIPGNAVDLLRNAPAGDWRVVFNGPTNAPRGGSIVVWGPCPPVGIGAYGHCGIAVAADSMELLTLDQNWPPGAPVATVIHDYRGVLGWLEPS